MGIYRAYYHSKIGVLEVTSTEEAITSVQFLQEQRTQESRDLPPVLTTCLKELDEYFHGQRTAFSVKMESEGTAFQQQVWHQVRHIPYGATVSYKGVAEALDKPTAVRAVGSANGKNRLAILIPCHRVIGSDGSLHGYAWELWRKKWLIRHETIERQVELSDSNGV